MAYEYDPLIMISLPRLTFVYIIYHLSNPFFFSNFPWFSKERLTDIDKINQTFNLLNRKSIEKLEFYLIHGIPTTNNVKRKNSVSAKKSGKRNSTLSTHSNKDNMILPKDINNDSSESPEPQGVGSSTPFNQDTTMETSSKIKIPQSNHRLSSPPPPPSLIIPNSTNFENSYPSSSFTSPLAISTPCDEKVESGFSECVEKKDGTGELKSTKIVDEGEGDKLLKSPPPSSSATTIPSSKSDAMTINQKLEIIDGEGVGSPREEEDWSFNNEVEEEEEAVEGDSLSDDSSDEDEIIGDILIRKVFKSVCMIVDEFQSSEVAIKLNDIMRNVFEKGIEKLEEMKEEEEEEEATTQLAHSSSRPITTSKKVVQSKLAT
ncbi:hypothetical protein PIROE2DRAFT_10781 [Piromyces sp. E2]|nr:hypothetical protein PIROE2DRAFT_10781 [Piromyces sp. E2]|eukprot:OUM62806.1 hypothetical protein PIROE2DRAFT_10781 [Piromyces sp. E2]